MLQGQMQILAHEHLAKSTCTLTTFREQVVLRVMIRERKFAAKNG